MDFSYRIHFRCKFYFKIIRKKKITKSSKKKNTNIFIEYILNFDQLNAIKMIIYFALNKHVKKNHKSKFK